MTTKRKIALFGLSANPPTGNSGHRGIIKSIYEKKLFDEIVIIPVYRHMFPEKHAAMQPFEHRFNMCKINFSGIAEANDPCKIYVSDFERTLFLQMAKERPSHFDEKGELIKPFQLGTMELIEALQRDKYPSKECSLHWILGSDTFRDMMNGKWTRTEELLNAVMLEVFYRVNIDLDIDENPQKYPLRKLAQVNYHSIPSLGPISSTEIRKATLSSVDRNYYSMNRFVSKASFSLASIESLPLVNKISPRTLSYLHPDVLNYIIDQRLYGFSQSTKLTSLHSGIMFASIGLILAWQLIKRVR